MGKKKSRRRSFKPLAMGLPGQTEDSDYSTTQINEGTLEEDAPDHFLKRRQLILNRIFFLRSTNSSPDPHGSNQENLGSDIFPMIADEDQEHITLRNESSYGILAKGDCPSTSLKDDDGFHK
ncbi:hypothetical protein Dimus_026787, partial [Dionaea muscipula]